MILSIDVCWDTDRKAGLISKGMSKKLLVWNPLLLREQNYVFMAHLRAHLYGGYVI